MFTEPLPMHYKIYVALQILLLVILLYAYTRSQTSQQTFQLVTFLSLIESYSFSRNHKCTQQIVSLCVRFKKYVWGKAMSKRPQVSPNVLLYGFQ